MFIFFVIASFVCFYFANPVPISFKAPYLLFGSREETDIFGNTFLILFSNPFSALMSGGN